MRHGTEAADDQTRQHLDRHAVGFEPSDVESRGPQRAGRRVHQKAALHVACGVGARDQHARRAGREIQHGHLRRADSPTSALIVKRTARPSGSHVGFK